VPSTLLASRRLLVIIPALNEEASLPRVIGNVRAAVPEADVLVINDGSRDRTAQVAAAAGAFVVSLPYNLGIGAAVQTGFMFARNGDYDYAIQVDGDGQHDPDEISVILDPLASGLADVTAGARYIEDRGYITPWPRRIGIIILAALISLIVRRRVTDPTSGFRASNRRAIEYCSLTYPADYPEPESVVQFARAGLRMLEVPVTMNARYGGQSSITPFRSFYYMVKVVLAILIDLLRQTPRIQSAR
jgi:glycosyltransferase involved in cell wall biosynthesis